ncbi:hypothetical protein WS70_12430 [Burkholderia mayonis]|uniref:Uncharacterized protein n=1 Tax=Burkholderia mayonis TaxID=1385591 RepID=A0A1B4FFP6_9BURK|nr:hypothetical protein WS70_12430 [Burkholderia mayonis]KVE44339.1 hypothetical protein WS69_20505 [Burkholderia sp. BDU5]KVE48759.1 hypothetical protein WS70_22170 [Burkholderia mayonis]
MASSAMCVARCAENVSAPAASCRLTQPCCVVVDHARPIADQTIEDTRARRAARECGWPSGRRRDFPGHVGPPVACRVAIVAARCAFLGKSSSAAFQRGDRE